MNWRWNFLEKLRFDYEGELLNKRGRGSFYEDVLDDQDKSGVDYSTWYDTRSDEYNRWYDTRSDIYNEWYDARSDIYNFYSDLSTEFYSEDQKRVDKVIAKLEKKIEKRK